ncbi:MAG: substrate-binding domain-containing protein, partial [Planctomycetota bacterium]
VVGTHCTGLDTLLAPLTRAGLSIEVLAVGSRGGLEAARQGACDVAPIHLQDRTSGVYNTPFVEEGMRLLPGYGRRQGLVFRPEIEPRLGETADPAMALRRAAADPALRIANRNPGSGTRALVEDLLAGTLARLDARPPGWATTYRSHCAVAAAIAQHRADYGVCLEQTAREEGLAWRELGTERYDFLVPEARWERTGVRAFRRALADPAVRAALRREGFDA